MSVSKLMKNQEYGEISRISDEDKNKTTDKAQNRFLACSYIKVIDKTQYGKIKEDLFNEFLKG